MQMCSYYKLLKYAHPSVILLHSRRLTQNTSYNSFLYATYCDNAIQAIHYYHFHKLPSTKNQEHVLLILFRDVVIHHTLMGVCFIILQQV